MAAHVYCESSSSYANVDIYVNVSWHIFTQRQNIKILPNSKTIYLDIHVVNVYGKA